MPYLSTGAIGHQLHTVQCRSILFGVNRLIADSIAHTVAAINPSMDYGHDMALVSAAIESEYYQLFMLEGAKLIG